ncbi:MAG: NAD(P)/FAD-dependent oxidoreductase [Gemmatimonadota bacterium]
MAEQTSNTDIVVIGAGIAGASIAYELAASRRVVLLERESQPGYHTTGRSAAMYAPAYGNAAVRALTRASQSFYDAPPAGFSAVPLLIARGMLFIGTTERATEARQMLAEPQLARILKTLTPDEVLAWIPILRRDACVYALLDMTSKDIDAHALHWGYLRAFKARGGETITNAEVRALQREPGGWRLDAGTRVLRAPIVVNAGGAWVDEIAQLAGLAPLGMRPLRRTALTVEVPPAIDIARWPAVIEIAETFYFKPDAGRLLICPADETPSPPCDAQPEEIDVALAVDHFERATTQPVKRVIRKWAGLRTFAPDRSPVAGFDPRAPGFFWMAGQGGYGLQMGPALARAAAALALELPLPADIMDEGVEAAALSPRRLLESGA